MVFDRFKDKTWYETVYFDDGLIQDFGLYRITYKASNREFKGKFLSGYDGMNAISTVRFASLEDAKKNFKGVKR